MARSLFWKEKVALSILLLLFVASALAQTSSSSTITYTCRVTRLETVIDFLSKKTGYDFIYSRNLVDLSRPVSITVNNKPINDVLILIERQADVSFMLRDHHIIVKSNPRPAPVITQSTTARQLTRVEQPPSFKSNDSLLITSVSRHIPTKTFESQALLLESHLEKRINELQKLLGPNVPRNIPRYYVNRINFNNRYKSWYAAVGSYVGDGSAGLELQAGLPYLYAVFTPRWSAEHGFYGAYGVGNSFALTGNFSFNTVYMYSTRSKTESVYPLATRMQAGPEFRHVEAERQHQVKLLLQYALSKNISVRVGPVLNYRNTVNQTSIVSPAMSESFMYRQLGTATTGSPTFGYQNGPFISPSKTTRLFETWVGWDASIQYRINFFDRK